jgi:uncharacterized protein YndB with AHSA1/START domain
MTNRERRATETIHRTYRASLADVWELWTTKDGLEAWWGPEGFLTTVDELDLRPGGRFRFRMRAVGAPQVEFMQKAGRPLESASTATFLEVVPQRRIAFENLVDFLPGVEPYTSSTSVDFEADGADVKLTVVLQAMHDERMTKFAVMGWNEQLGRLEKRLAHSTKETQP